MGQSESKNKLMFTKLLHQMLRKRGVDVKKKHVSKFLEIVYVLCPWVPEEGSLDESTWSKIGTKIEEYAAAHQFSPQAELLLSVWPHLRQAICLPHCFPGVSLASSSSSFSCKSNPDGGGGGGNLPPCNPLNEPDSALGVGPEARNGGAPDEKIGAGAEISASESAQVRASAVPSISTLEELSRLLASLSKPQAFPAVTTLSSKPVVCSMPREPILATTYAFESMRQGFPDSDLHLVCPVIEVTNQNGEIVRHYEPIPPKFMKDFKEAVTNYGPTAPYTLSLLENFGTQAMTPADWHRIANACLSGGDYLLWKAYYDDAAFELAEKNERQRVGVNLQMLKGTGDYESVQAQVALPEAAFGQVNALALRAWRKLPTHGEFTDEITKIKQGNEEPYQNFISRLMQAVKRQFGDSESAQ
uniref:Uncharacterized protein n=1 Tax=Callithrix jacchus TaxID=9483 RepID=A0A5F4W0A3_CALJA